MNNIKIYTITVCIMVFAGFLFVPMLSPLLNKVIIGSSGQILVKEVIARSGSPQDIQAAVDAVLAAGGGTVRVPSGTYNFDNPPEKGHGVIVVTNGKSISIIGAGMDVTILQATKENQPVGSAMFYIDGRGGGRVRISGITFKGKVVTTEEYSCYGVILVGCEDFRVDHCKFIDFAGGGVAAENAFSPPYGVNRGVIDHCEFDNPYKESIGGDWCYGVELHGRRLWQNLDSLLGHYDGLTDVVYIEDCVFKRCRYAVGANDGVFYVFRYNTVYLCPLYGSWAKAGVDCHEGGTNYPGARGLECYNNKFKYVSGYGQQGVKMRAGGGVIYNNVFEIDIGVWLIKADWAQNEQNYVKDLYIWNNTYYKTPLQKDNFYQENVHYFLRAKSGYIPYPYPHPLTTTP
ncbi:MAG: hypothetical protein QXY73_05875 [Candidatus Bathyarchaeia archaeon]